MSLAPEYSELLDKLAQGCADQDWQSIAGPPAPTGINQFPLTPPPEVVSRRRLPDRILVEDKYEGQITNQEKLTNQCLIVMARYNNFLNATASPSTPFSRTYSITVGAEETTSFSLALELSMGVSIGGIGDLGATLTTTFAREIKLSTSTTITTTFSLAPPSGEISASWWQAEYVYLLRSQKVTTFYGETTTEEIEEQFYDRAETYIPTQYPPVSKSDGSLYILEPGHF
ncbi:hypothetical protein Cylst_5387 [Cylindrospermum stagnale PCC 7417]|uniref:Uncharacterized protein n=1 Tax=Cylindrospermum stagnale PCC 7417 TaxID=56107 RepID=K9X5P2_9NOST|nr:hypothetical protein [Cylindrospermum stagnale]AFZ27409.1 hypothetical protein Cylst_5387 [Cylindrospermum stagnale PCC 7417]